MFLNYCYIRSHTYTYIFALIFQNFLNLLNSIGRLKNKKRFLISIYIKIRLEFTDMSQHYEIEYTGNCAINENQSTSQNPLQLNGIAVIAKQTRSMVYPTIFISEFIYLCFVRGRIVTQGTGRAITFEKKKRMRKAVIQD